MFILKCIIRLGIIGAIILAFMYYFPTVNIDGDSMYPTYSNNEKVRGCRLLKNQLKVGHVYVYTRTDSEGNIYHVIKRLHKMKYKNGEVKLFFLGDNKYNSTDSRDYGYINANRVVAKILNPRKNQFKEGGKDNEITKKCLKGC